MEILAFSEAFNTTQSLPLFGSPEEGYHRKVEGGKWYLEPPLQAFQ